MTSALVGVAIVATVIGVWLAWSLRRSGIVLSLLLAVGVPGLAAVAYLNLGNPQLGDLPLASRTEPAVQLLREENQYRQLTGMLAEQMRNQPDNVEGWQMLTRAYRNLSEWSFAIEAWRRVLMLKGEAASAQDWAEMAILLVQQAEGKVTPGALTMVERALAADPELPDAMHLQALSKAQSGDLAGAVRVWEAMLASAPPDADWRAPIAQYIAQARAEMAAPARGPSQQDMAAAAQMSPEERQAMIESMVEGLAARLEDEPDDPQGWLRLARAYGVLGRTADADSALDRAVETAEVRMSDQPAEAPAMQAVLAQAAAMRAQLPR